MSNWQIEGQYFETCNCDYLCPCISSNLGARPTEGDCKVALPSNAGLALAKANAASIHAFGIDFDNNSGSKNGHFAPFAWSA